MTLRECALKRLQWLVDNKKLLPKVAKDFKSGLRYYSDYNPIGFGVLYWAHQDGGLPEHIDKTIREIEDKYNVCVYHITHEHASFGELWDLWCVSNEDCDKNEEEWRFEDFKNGITFAYVVNDTVPEYSEFGSISYDVVGGGCIRTA